MIRVLNNFDYLVVSFFSCKNYSLETLKIRRTPCLSDPKSFDFSFYKWDRNKGYYKEIN